jgi:hypothetical protein
MQNLLDSTGDEDWISIETLRAAFGGHKHGLEDGLVSSLVDAFADLERAFGSLSKERIARTTKTLQATQLAVRHLATDPDRPINAGTATGHSGASSTLDELMSKFHAPVPVQDNRVPAHDHGLPAQDDRVLVPEDQVQTLKDRLKASEDRTQALEDALQNIRAQLSDLADRTPVRDEDGPDDEVKKEETHLETKAAWSLIKRPSTVPEDKAVVKRSRS